MLTLSRSLSRTFHREAAAILGETSADGAMTLFDPSHVDDRLPGVTYMHERVHQAFLRLTTFGHFTNLLQQLSTLGLHEAERDACFDDQEPVQELAAYYISLTYLARLHPEHLEENIESIPTAHRANVETLMRLLPVRSEPVQLLFARGVVVEAIARSALNSDCLSVFKQPDALTADRLADYLARESTVTRLQRIFELLHTSGAIRDLEAHAAAQFDAADPARSADTVQGEIADRIVRFTYGNVFVAMPLQILAGVLTFVHNWNETANGQLHVPPPTFPEPVIKESDAHLEAIRRQPDFSRRLDRDSVEMLFDLAQPHSGELYLWFYMKQSDELMVDLFFAGRDANGKVPSDSLERFRQGLDYGHGIVATEWFAERIDKAAPGSIVATFYRDAWMLWLHATKKRHVPAFHLQGTRETEVSPEALDRMLRFPGLRESTSWYGVDFGDDIRAGYLVSETNPTVFGVQKLSTPVATNAFADLLGRAGIPASSAHARSIKRTLEVAAYPFVAPLLSSRENGTP